MMDRYINEVIEGDCPEIMRTIPDNSDENDIVLDPFVGTGTTVIAAKKLGRRYIGIDIDPLYVAMTKQHLEKTKTYSKIDDVWVSFYLGEIVTVRDKDWEKIEGYFAIPEPIKEIEYQRIRLDSQWS